MSMFDASKIRRRGVIPEPVLALCQRLESHGHQAWVVGGCVRDLLLEKTVNDWDLATSATPQQVQRVFRTVIPTGIAHGTVTVLLDGSAQGTEGTQGYEVTTLRGEGTYTDGRRPDEVYFVSDIEDDLARRDFTVNAMAYAPNTDRLADPFGGMRDLQARCLRAVGDPRERFAEDGLRILRGARFVATLGMTLESATEAAFAGALSTFTKVSRERVRDEWVKTMKAAKPSQAFEVMRRTGILDVTFPELVTQYGCEQNRWHAYDVWHHTMAVLDAATGSTVDKLAALLHDVGKPITRAHGAKTNDWTFYHHERVGAKMADRWLRQYRFSNQARAQIVHLVRHHLVCYDPSWSDAAVRRFVRRVGTDGVAPLLRLARADAQGKGRPVEEELALLHELNMRVEKVTEENTALSIKDLHVNGHDVLTRLDNRGGRMVGDLLRALLERVLDEPSLNERATLLRLLDDLIEENHGIR